LNLILANKGHEYIDKTYYYGKGNRPERVE